MQQRALSVKLLSAMSSFYWKPPSIAFSDSRVIPMSFLSNDFSTFLHLTSIVERLSLKHKNKLLWSVFSAQSYSLLHYLNLYHWKLSALCVNNSAYLITARESLDSHGNRDLVEFQFFFMFVLFTWFLWLNQMWFMKAMFLSNLYKA